MTPPRSPLDVIVDTVKSVDHPSPRQIEEGWSALQTMLTTGPAPAPWGVKPTTMAAKPWWWMVAKIGIACTLAAGGGSFVAWRTVPAIETPPSRPVDRLERFAGVRSFTDAPASRNPEVQTSSSVEARGRPPRTTNRSPTTAAREQKHVESANPVEQDTLVQQAQLLGHAWTATERGQIEEALHDLDEHLTRFPRSPLDPERRACRIVVDCMRRDPGAIERAHAFLSSEPEGVHASRIRDACGLAVRNE